MALYAFISNIILTAKKPYYIHHLLLNVVQKAWQAA
jgi:hypothetical protein